MGKSEVFGGVSLVSQSDCILDQLTRPKDRLIPVPSGISAKIPYCTGSRHISRQKRVSDGPPSNSFGCGRRVTRAQMRVGGRVTRVTALGLISGPTSPTETVHLSTFAGFNQENDQTVS